MMKSIIILILILLLLFFFFTAAYSNPNNGKKLTSLSSPMASSVDIRRIPTLSWEITSPHPSDVLYGCFSGRKHCR